MKQLFILLYIVIGSMPVHGGFAEQEALSKVVEEVFDGRWPSVPEVTKERVKDFYGNLFANVEEVVDLRWFLDQVEIDLKALSNQGTENDRWIKPFTDLALEAAVSQIINYPDKAEVVADEVAYRIQYVYERTMKLFTDSETWAFPVNTAFFARQVEWICSRAEEAQTGQYVPPWPGSKEFRFRIATFYLGGLLGHAKHLLETGGEYAALGFRSAAERGLNLTDRTLFIAEVDRTFDLLADVQAATDLAAFRTLMIQACGMTWRSNHRSVPTVVEGFDEATEAFKARRGEFIVFRAPTRL